MAKASGHHVAALSVPIVAEREDLALRVAVVDTGDDVCESVILRGVRDRSEDSLDFAEHDRLRR